MAAWSQVEDTSLLEETASGHGQRPRAASSPFPGSSMGTLLSTAAPMVWVFQWHTGGGGYSWTLGTERGEKEGAGSAIASSPTAERPAEDASNTWKKS